MKIYRNIVIVLSIMLGIVSAVLMTLSNPLAIESFKDSITSESYQNLKDYAFEIASNSDAKPKEDIIASMHLTNEFLIVDVDTSMYGIEAIFPISRYDEKIKDGIIKFEGKIDYNNVTYSEHTDVKPSWLYIYAGILMAVATAALLYLVFYYMPSQFIKRETD